MTRRLFALCGAMLAANLTFAQVPEWTSDNLNQECDRNCLVGIMDQYMDAMFAHDTSAVPTLATNYRMTENTGMMEVGEGVLWRNRTQPTPFKIYVADPVTGQVALQARIQVVRGRGGGSDILIAVRLKVDRGEISEIEHLWASGINPAAVELLTTPRVLLTTDISTSERISRDAMFRVANS